jgi:hypothetical protein
VVGVAAFQRDPLSARYDTAARRALVAGIRAWRAGRGSVRVFIVSPGPQMRDLDRGGRTRNERAFTRACYYHVIQVPRQQARARGLPTYEARIDWSLKLTWGPVENRGGKYGRQARLRMFTKRGGHRHVKRNKGTAYTEHPELQSRAALESA